MPDAHASVDYGERIARLEERMTNLVDDVRELRVDVGELNRTRAAAEAIARDATKRAVLTFRSREVMVAVAGLGLTALNIAIATWGS